MKKNAKLFRAMTELTGGSVITRFVGRSHESETYPQKLGKISRGRCHFEGFTGTFNVFFVFFPLYFAQIVNLTNDILFFS